MSSNAEIAESAAADYKLNNSEGTNEEFQAAQLEEYLRVCRMLKFVQVKDDLDAALKEILERMLDVPPSMEKADFAYSDISDMAHALLSPESLLVSEFFARTTLAFRLFRRTLDLHMVKNKAMDAVLAIDVPDDDRSDLRIMEHIWLLLWVGAAATDVSSCLKQFRNNMSSSSRPMISTKTDGNKPNQRLPGTTSTEQDVRHQILTYSAAVHGSNHIIEHIRPASIPGQNKPSGSDVAHLQSKKGYTSRAPLKIASFKGPQINQSIM